MKDFSFFLLNNSLGAKMKKSFRTFCNGDGSTSTLNQRETNYGDSSCNATRSQVDSPFLNDATLRERQPTLEEMILQLELEEKMVRRTKLDDYGEFKHRMSCVNSSDILRTARNALNQYPRFSLDGKDAMYRSSFRNLTPGGEDGRKSICCNGELRKRFDNDGLNLELENKRTLRGESVVWCKPGVVAKLMGLEAMPIPSNRNFRRERLSSIIKKQNLRRAERNEIERGKIVVDTNGCGGRIKKGMMNPCSTTSRYCVMKPVAMELAHDEAGWPMRHFL